MNFNRWLARRSARAVAALRDKPAGFADTTGFQPSPALQRRLTAEWRRLSEKIQPGGRLSLARLEAVQVMALAGEIESEVTTWLAGRGGPVIGFYYHGPGGYFVRCAGLEMTAADFENFFPSSTKVDVSKLAGAAPAIGE